jgi:mannose-6-phosphate isomerase-like protein (cupin superfamily)
MAEYTIKNLREVQDMAPKFGLAPDMEARFPARELGLEHTGFSLQGLAPNATQPFGHSHRKQEEVYLVLSGSGRVKLDDEVVDLHQWDAIRIAPEVTRALSAGPEGIEYLAFGASEGISPAEDAEQKPGWWSGDGAGV